MGVWEMDGVIDVGSLIACVLVWKIGGAIRGCYYRCFATGGPMYTRVPVLTLHIVTHMLVTSHEK